MSMASDLSDPSEIVSDALIKFSLNEIDYDWLMHRNCETHGRSCPCLGTVTQDIQSVYAILEKDEKKVDRFISNYYNLGLTDELKAIIKSSIYAVFINGEKKHTHFDYGSGGSIEGTLIQIIGSEISKNHFQVAIGVIKFVERTCHDHHFLPEYYDANEERVINALKYLFYKDIKQKIENTPRFRLN